MLGMLKPNGGSWVAGASCEPGGIVESERHLPGFRMSVRVYPAGLDVGEHRHGEPLLVYILSGEYIETRGEDRRLCVQKTIQYIPAGTLHGNIFEGECKCLMVQFRPEELRSLPELPEEPAEIAGVAAQWLANRMEREFHLRDDVSALALEGILLESLAELVRSNAEPASSAAPRWLRSTRQWIDSHFLDPLTLEQIAEVGGVHRVHLSREFRRHFGLTVGDYIRKKRIEHACSLMTSSSASLAQIAITCGFADQSHFSSIFRREMGVTPAKYREIHHSR